MHSKHIFIRTALLALLLLGFTWQTNAQQYVNAVVPTPMNTTLPDNAIDADDKTAATLTATPVFGNASLRLGFAQPVAAQNIGSLLIKITTTLTASNSLIIKTYLNGTLKQEFSLASGGANFNPTPGTLQTVQFPVGIEFNQVELSTSGLVTVNVSVDLFRAYASTSRPLPVELVAFQAKSTSAGTALAWSTASERNSDYFVVERADGSPENFRALRQVSGAGTTSQPTQYNFVDVRPAVLSYYRLRQVDRDGTTSFSPVVFVKTAVSNLPLVVYPSPATETVVVTGAVGTRYALFDQLGRQLQTGEVLDGIRPALDVRALPGGVYFVRDLATGSSSRFVKVAAE